MNKRDTQFAGAAKCLLQALIGRTPEDQEVIAAQYSYDLLVHGISNINTFEFSAYGDDYVIDKMPDMAEWPKKGVGHI